MTAITWGTASLSGAWTNATLWAGGVAPGAADTVTIAALGSYAISLTGQAQVAALTLNAPGALLYNTGSLTVSGICQLSAGTLALAGGTLSGGTLALAGGTLACNGGSLAGIAVAGLLDLSANYATLFLRQGVSFGGLNGTGTGSITLTGAYAMLAAIGSQAITNTNITLGTQAGGAITGGAATLAASHAFGATTAATLTLGATTTLRQTSGAGLLLAGASNTLPGSTLPDQIFNAGTISLTGGSLGALGNGVFANAGTINISNGATFTVATGGFSNTGSIAVSNATLAFGGSFAATRLTALGRVGFSQATLLVSGIADNRGGTLTLGAGGNVAAPLTLGGTILGGTIVDAGNGLLLGPANGVLDGVTYRGTLTLADRNALTLTNGAALTSGAGSAPGIANITGAAGAILLRGTTTLDRATINLGNATSAAMLGTSDPWLASSATTATLGANLQVVQTAKYAAILTNGTTPLAGVGLADVLINQGTITGTIASGAFALGGVGLFINAGTLSIGNGDTLTVSVAGFSNTGLLAVNAGAVAILGAGGSYLAPGSAWTNTGTITLNAGTLVLAGIAQTGALGRITSGATAGSVVLTGTLQNTGTTLTLGAGFMLPNLTLAGTLQGGTLIDTSTSLTIGTTGAAVFDGLAYRGTLTMANAASILRIKNGFSATALAISGAGAALNFQGTQNFNTSSVALGNANTAAIIDMVHDYTSLAATTLTLGTALNITQSNTLAAIGSVRGIAGDIIVNQGTITGAIAGGTLSLGGPGFSNQGIVAISNGDTLAINTANFTNTGNVSVSNATLAIGGTLTLGAISNITLNAANLAVSGGLDCSGGTLAVGVGTRFGRVSLTGTLHGGVIADSGQGLATAGNATLDALSYWGTLDLSRPFAQVALTNGLTFAGNSGTGQGAIMLTGAGTRVIATTSQTLDNATIYDGNFGTFYLGQRIGAPLLAAGPGTTLTLGKNLLFRTAGMVAALGDATTGRWADTIINTGQILAATTGGTLTIGSTFFINQGGIAIGQGGNVSITCAGFTNASNMSLVAGSAIAVQLYNFYAAPNAPASPFTNTGTLHMLGGAFAEVTAGGIFPTIPFLNQAGGLIQGVGSINAPVQNNGLMEAKYGPLILLQAITGTGTLQIAQASTGQLNTLDCGTTIGAGQTVNFTGINEALKLEQPSLFAATINNFGAGDQIQLIATTLSALSVNNTQLTLATAAGIVKLTTTTPITGAIAASTDGRGNAIITITPQTLGGGATIVNASQSGMLFYAGTTGDVFTGTAANLTADRIGNWTNTDTIDITDIAPAAATLKFTQGLGAATLTLTDPTHSAIITLPGTFAGPHFALVSDGHGGTLVTYS